VRGLGIARKIHRFQLKQRRGLTACTACTAVSTVPAASAASSATVTASGQRGHDQERQRDSEDKGFEHRWHGHQPRVMEMKGRASHTLAEIRSLVRGGWATR
jgi:hypothetical protein